MNTKINVFLILSFCFLSGNCIFGNTTDELGPSYDSQKLEEGRLTVPACCPTENYNDTEGSCKPTNMTSSFSPPIIFRSGKSAVQYEITTVMNTISCNNNNEDKIEVLIDSSKENDSLLYDSDAVFLISKSDPRIKEISQLEDFVIVPPSDYCITNIAGDYLGVYCIPNYAHRHDMFCEDHICYRKCCPEGEIVDIYNMTCIIPEDDVDMCSPGFFSSSSINKFSQRIHFIDLNESQLMVGEQPCVKMNSMKPSGPFFVLYSGYLHHANTTKEYCIDNFKNSSIINGLLFCKIKLEKTYLFRTILISSTIITFSLMCFLCVKIRELREKMHGKILIGYFVSLILAYITTLLIVLASRQNTTTEIEIRVLSKF